MFKVLTEKECAKKKKEYDKWWHGLSLEDKSTIFSFCKNVVNSKGIKESIEKVEKERTKNNPQLVFKAEMKFPKQ